MKFKDIEQREILDNKGYSFNSKLLNRNLRGLQAGLNHNFEGYMQRIISLLFSDNIILTKSRTTKKHIRTGEGERLMYPDGERD